MTHYWLQVWHNLPSSVIAAFALIGVYQASKWGVDDWRRRKARKKDHGVRG